MPCPSHSTKWSISGYVHLLMLVCWTPGSTSTAARTQDNSSSTKVESASVASCWWGRLTCAPVPVDLAPSLCVSLFVFLSCSLSHSLSSLLLLQDAGGDVWPQQDLIAAGMQPKPPGSTTTFVYKSTMTDVASYWAGVLAQVQYSVQYSTFAGHLWSWLTSLLLPCPPAGLNDI